jgi:hypothetical protein
MKKENKLFINARLQREINRSRVLKEAYIPLENLVDADIRTLIKKMRLL